MSHGPFKQSSCKRLTYPSFAQNMFIFFHIIVPIPCAGGSTGCGSALSFDVVNDNVFLSLLSSSGSSSPPAPSGAWNDVGCRSGTGFPRAGSWQTTLADCLNIGSANNWVYAGMSVCGTGDFACRRCDGCTQLDVDEGTCVISGNSVVEYNNISAANYPCDPMGGYQDTATGKQFYTFLCAFRSRSRQQAMGAADAFAPAVNRRFVHAHVPKPAPEASFVVGPTATSDCTGVSEHANNCCRHEHFLVV